MASCQNCNKGLPEVVPRLWAKCQTANYCSRDCQKADWKTHKKTCGKQDKAGGSSPSSSAFRLPDGMTIAYAALAGPAGILPLGPVQGNAPSPPKGTDKPVTKPFTRISNNMWLYDRSPEDVYRLLIDTYRVRVKDLYKFEGGDKEDGDYSGPAAAVPGFIRFVDKIEKTGKGILPPWWDANRMADCVAMGIQGKEWQDHKCSVEDSDIQEHYGDPKFPMQLRLFAESIYGSTPWGSGGLNMLGLMAALEN